MKPLQAGNVYRCSQCKGTFETDRDDEEAIAEFKRDYPGEKLGKLICRDCYTKLYAVRIAPTFTRDGWKQ